MGEGLGVENENIEGFIIEPYLLPSASSQFAHHRGFFRSN
jgi:hypothetical protein